MRVLRYLFGLVVLAGVVARLEAATVTVNMQANQFVPKNITINVGDTVTWVNLDPRGHDTVSGSGGVPSGVWNSNNQYGRLMARNETFSFTFNNAGTFPYYCTPHWAPFNMVGTVTVNQPNVPPSISISTPTSGQNFSAPANVTIAANASDAGGSIAQVQFTLNGSPLGTVTAPPYSVSANDLGAGNYTVVATAFDNDGASASDSVSFSVTGAAPVLFSTPQSQIVNVGSDVTFTAGAGGSAPLSYQWSYNDQPIAGATGTSLFLQSVTEGQSGSYTISVNNSFGSASATASLVVTNAPIGQPPTITAQPESHSVMGGTAVSFTVNAIGSTPLYYQWFFDNVPMPDGTGLTLGLTNVTESNSGDYFVVVSNNFGVATSSVAVLSVIVPPTCEFSLSSSPLTFSTAGGTGTVNVVATSQDCNWTITNTNSWIQILSGGTGIGDGAVTLRVVANPLLTARTGNILISGLPFAITQAAASFQAKCDFNKDGFTDLVWQHSSGRVALWLMNGRNLSRAVHVRGGVPASPGWQIVGVSDFTGDGQVDILWQNVNGPLAIWVMNGTTFVRSQLLEGLPRLPAAWRFAGMADLSGDGKTDLLFRHRDGYLLVWLMNGNKFVSQSLLFDGEPVPPEWSVSVLSDLTADRQADILWRNGTGTFVLWRMLGTFIANGTAVKGLPSSPWGARLVSFADINRDGKTDFIWRHPDARLSVWFMDGTSFRSAAQLNNGYASAPGWSPK